MKHREKKEKIGALLPGSGGIIQVGYTAVAQRTGREVTVSITNVDRGIALGGGGDFIGPFSYRARA